MICINNENVVKKYAVELNEEKLNKLRTDIINNCSHIVHIEDRISCFDAVRLSDEIDKDPLKIRIHEKEEDYLNEYFYNIKYDFYEYPPIIKKIDKVLKSKSDKCSYEFLKYIKESCVSKETWKKVLKHSNYMGSDELNKKQKPVGYYFPDLLNTINLVFVDEMSLDDFNKMYKFIDGEKEIKENNLILIKE